ncbi:c-type cytochrome [Planctomycetaceae bacterium SH139]
MLFHPDHFVRGNSPRGLLSPGYLPWKLGAKRMTAGFLAFAGLFMGVVGPAARGEDGVWKQAIEIAPSMTFGADEQETTPPPIAASAWNAGPTPKWIWGPDENQPYRLAIEFEATTTTAGMLRASCDNVMVVYLNDRRLAGSDSWEETTEIDLSQALVEGRNRLEVAVSNQGGVAGFVAKLGLVQSGQPVRWIVSDASWTATTEADSQPADVRVVAKLGDGPWRQALSNVPAPGSAPRDVFLTQPGFQVERLFTVPRDELGSWVAITVDPQGRLIASDQGDKGLCRITLPAVGSDDQVVVEKLDLPITSAQGLLFAFDSLYISVNGGPGSGLYRAQDTTQDGELDKLTKLKNFRGGGEHGPHALRLAPDGKSLYVICGNHTDPPENFSASRLPTNWSEDHLLPRQWDANGHARGKLAPGGWIARTDPNGETWEMFSIGYRNPYDMDFNADGELFAYDADMEWDLGSPWYRPTRVVHATSGSEFGWRSGTGKWPTYYEDSLPPVVDIGPGSPVGAEFGYGAKFPGKYQRAFYICDWTFGTMYAIHLTPDGASYSGEKEEFIARTPLPLTDVAIGRDGAMYFTIGGRGTQSELFRVTYVGDQSTAAIDPRDEAGESMRALRRELEAYHGKPAENVAAAIKKIWPALGHSDRFLRYAARVALEAQPLEQWRGLVAADAGADIDAWTRISLTIALAHQGSAADLDTGLSWLDGVNFAELTSPQKVAWSRALQLLFIRCGTPTETVQQAWANKLEPHYPAADQGLNRELSQLLVYLRSEPVVAKTVALLEKTNERQQSDLAELIARNQGYGGTIAAMLANQPDAQQIHYALVLRNATAGWNTELREAYFRWFNKARQWSGGASFQGFLTNIDREAFDQATDAERLAVEALGARKPFVLPERPAPQGPGQVWTVASVIEASGQQLRGRDFESGKRAFAAASCIVCHRFAGEGGATGPDLTQAAGRFGIKEMAEAIVEPNRVISDQYRASIVLTAAGTAVTGRIVSENDQHYIVLTDPQDSSKVVEIAKDEVEEIEPSPISLMPADLINPLNQDEVLDMIAYLLSRGNKNDPMFRR